MATFAQMLTAGFDVSTATGLIGERVTIRGTAYDAVVSTSPESEMFAGGGSVDSTPIIIELRRSAVPTDLRKGEKVTYGGNDYTIRQVDDDALAFITLIGDSAGKRK